MKKTTLLKKTLFTLLLFFVVSGVAWSQASLPFSYDLGRPTSVTGLTHTGLGTDYASTPKMKFDTSADNLVLNFSGNPGTLTFSIKWNQSTAAARFPGDFTLLESDNGTTYTTVQLYNSTNGTALANGTTKTETFTNLKSTTRYLKWEYTAKSNGNIAIGAITLAASSNPTISAPSSTSLTGFTTTEGAASASQTFTIGGSGLTDNLVVTAPTNYEVKESGVGSFGSSVSFTPSSGSVSSKTVEVRIAASALAGSPSGDVTCSSTGATTQNVAVSGTVSAASGQSQTITFGSLASKSYGDASFGLSATASSGLAVTYASSNTDVATVSGSTVTIVGAGSTNITASQAGNGTYNPAVAVVQPLTVNAKELTIGGATVTTKSYTGTNAAVITGSLVGVINSDDVSFVGAGVFTDVNVGVGIPVTSSCSLSGTKAMNYVLTQPSGLTGEITKASQTISFGTLTDKTNGDSPFSLSASASSALTVSYSSSNTAVATVSGNTVTIVGVGATIITASQDGNSNYEAATPVERTLNVGLPAPVATSATGLQGVDASSNSFVANWNAVSGATTYQVNVYTKTGGGGSTTTTTDFEGSTSFPSGWSGLGYVQNVQTNAYAGSNYAGLNLASKFLLMPLQNNPKTLEFYYRFSSATANCVVKVQTAPSDSTSWTDVATFGATGSGASTSYVLASIPLNYTGDYYVKFIMTSRTSGSYYFDNVALTSGSPSVSTPIAGSPFAVTDGTQLAVSNVPVGVYYYTVTATNGVQTSSNSNEISVTIDVATDLNKLSSAMKVRVVGGRLFVTGVSEYSVYNSQGVEICKMNSDKSDNSVALRPGIYVVRAGAKSQKVIVK